MQAGGDTSEAHLTPGRESPAEPPSRRTAATTVEVERRAAIARYVIPLRGPVGRSTLLRTANVNGAPDDVLAQLASLPREGVFATVQEIVRALGYGTHNPGPAQSPDTA